MKRLQETIEVPLSPERVFRYTADFSNIEQWDPGVAESEKLTPGPLAVGSQFRVVVRAGPLTTEMRYEVTEFEPPHRVVLQGSGGSVRAIDEIRFHEVPTGTRIDYTADIGFTGLASLFEPFSDGALERVGKKAMAGLREALSSEPRPPAESLGRNLLDRLVLPGALGFTRFGYALRKRSWPALPASLEGKTAIVTGATSGLGRVTAERLAALGARVVLVGRDAAKLQQAVTEIRAGTGSDFLHTELADLSLMSEVRQLAHRLLEHHGSIDILVNNAAVLPSERTLTSEGLETAFATDLLSPFLLTRLLIPRMKESGSGRIVNVLSGGMYLTGLDVADLENARGRYDGSRAYARAKRGLMVLTELWAAELKDAGIMVNAMHPGWADTPGVRNSLPSFHRVTRPVLRTPEQGADTIVWLAAATEAGKVSGKLWLDREPHISAIFPGTKGSASQRDQLIEELQRLAA